MPRKRRESGEPTKGEAARERLLEAGERLFSVKDFDKVSIDDISNEAGVAHGLLFHYFKSKNDFYATLSRRASDRLETTHRKPRDEKTADEKLAMCLSGHMDFIKSRPAAFLFHARGGASAQVKKIWEDSRQRFIIMILTEFYGIPKPTPHLISAVRAWLGFFDEMVLAWIQDPKIKRSGMLLICVQLFNEVLKHSPLLDQEVSVGAKGGNRQSAAKKQLAVS
jgi:AcrR family transcriptional regulator